MSELSVQDPALKPIAEKIQNQIWLDEADGVALYRSRDIHGIGRMANYVSRSLHGDVVYYNRNRHINYTNVCALSCKFCSFYRKRGEAGAYEMSVEEVIAAAKNAADVGATEVHIVGGLHPWLKFDYYINMLSGIRKECPSLHIKAFTAIEIIHFSRIARMEIKDVLSELRNAGLGSLPGGGAEIFDDRVHDEAFKGKVREDKWFEVHHIAHELGIFTNATMLYGHVENVAERVRHLIKLREAQAASLSKIDEGTRRQGDEEKNRDSISSSPHPLVPSSAFYNCIIPLSFIPEDSELGNLPGPTGLTDLKTLAIARLMVPNIPNIKAFWIMQSIHLSQLALDWGCNDLDGTVVWYDITKREGLGTHQELHVEDIKRLIRESGHTPIERDTLYNEVKRDPATDELMAV